MDLEELGELFQSEEAKKEIGKILGSGLDFIGDLWEQLREHKLGQQITADIAKGLADFRAQLVSAGFTPDEAYDLVKTFTSRPIVHYKS